MKNHRLIFLTREEVVEVAEDCEKYFKDKKTFVFSREFFELLNSGSRIIRLDDFMGVHYYHEIEYNGHRFITITKNREYNPEWN